jgi:ABC-type nitrate/sulfonate/bicarbonate transport system ATPase subunit
MATGPEVSVALREMRFASAPEALFGALNFRVAPGEVVALIGPSGVGKTTLLRMIAGLQGGFDGAVLVGGVPPGQAPPPGFVFQDARLLPWLTAAENLRAVVPALTAPEVEALLERVGLGGQAAAYPRQMSGGMQRRLGVARALCVNPGLLLLDEPFVSLDRAMVQDLQSLLVTIFRAENPTVVLVSHDPQDAAALADRVVVLAGRPARIAADVALPRPDPAAPSPDVALALKAIETAQKEAVS